MQLGKFQNAAHLWVGLLNYFMHHAHNYMHTNAYSMSRCICRTAVHQTVTSLAEPRLAKHGSSATMVG